MPIPAEPSPPRCFAVVPCAGNGQRAGLPTPKQYVEIGGRAVIEHTLAALCAVDRLEAIVVVVAPDDDRFERAAGRPLDPRVRAVRSGGDARAESVAAGLDTLAQGGAAPSDWVLVHDAARCLVRAEWVDALIDACRGDEVGGLLAVPAADTLKHESSGRSVSTLPRGHIWHAQTPQMFRLGTLAEALAKAGAEASDEASAIEAMGLAPKLVVGSIDNLKITHAGDFAVAAAILAGRARSASGAATGWSTTL